MTPYPRFREVRLRWRHRVTSRKQAADPWADKAGYRACRRVPVSRSGPVLGYSRDFAKPEHRRCLGASVPAKVRFREVGRVCAPPLTAPRRILFSRSISLLDHSLDFAKPQSGPRMVESASAGVGFREVEGVCALLRKAPRQAPGFAKYICPGSFTRLRETRAWPERGPECPGGGPVSRSGGGLRPAAQGSVARPRFRGVHLSWIIHLTSRN